MPSDNLQPLLLIIVNVLMVTPLDFQALYLFNANEICFNRAVVMDVYRLACAG